MRKNTKETLLGLIEQFEREYGKFPTRRDIYKTYGVSDNPYIRVFGAWSKAVEEYQFGSCAEQPAPTTKNATAVTLVVPDAHVGPGQDLSRFRYLSKLIEERRPDRIIFLGDFVTLEALSNWDMSKSGIMEGRRYAEDIEAGNLALDICLRPVTGTYRPTVVYIKGNHEERLSRYMDTKPELKQHLSLDKDLNLGRITITDIVDYRDSIEFDGVIFTHAPQNAANQPVAGKYALHRAADMSAKSIVFGHTHRKEGVNYYRHGADNITQIFSAGAFFEHTDDYAVGGLNAYWRGLCLLTHWGYGRFDVEEVSLERLKQMYGGK